MTSSLRVFSLFSRAHTCCTGKAEASGWSMSASKGRRKVDQPLSLSAFSRRSVIPWPDQ
jgi:hypothetical protein